MTRYEHIGELTGVSMPPFAEMYLNEVLHMKGLVSDYIMSAKAQRDLLEAGGTSQPRPRPNGLDVAPYARQSKYSLVHTESGFPVLPRPLNTEGWLKADWEELHKEYLNWHYSE